MNDELERVFCKIDDVDVMKRFFAEIFTESERKDLALRWSLMRMLHEGATQRAISTTLGVSLCKITRGSKIVQDEHSVTRGLLDAGV